MFSHLRALLQRDVDAYNAKKAEFDQRIKDANFFSKLTLKAQKLQYMAANSLRITYEEYWLDDIDNGLRAWPRVSHDVATALFFNPQKKPDLERVKGILDTYVNKHLISMAGAPDFVGATRALIGKWSDAIVDAIGIPAVKQAISDMKLSLYNYAPEQNIRPDDRPGQGVPGSPATQFDLVLNQKAFFTEGGNMVSRAAFDRDELKLAGRTTFDYQEVPAAYNTVVMTKLLMMAPYEVNRLMRDLGSSKTLSGPCAVLGFARTLDGSNQWKVNPEKMVVAQDLEAYRKIFMMQKGGEP